MAAHFWRASEGKASLCRSPCPANRCASASSKTSAATRPPKSRRLSKRLAQRIVPGCRHFGACGGCNYQHASDCNANSISSRPFCAKHSSAAAYMRRQRSTVLAGEPWSYRNRIRLAFDAEGNPGYRGRRSHAVVPISECPIAAPLLVSAALTFVQVVRQTAPTFVPLRSLSSATRTKARCWQPFSFRTPERSASKRLRNRSPSGFPRSRAWSFCSRVKRVSRPRAIAQWGAPSLTYRAAGFDYRVDHGSFFQVNRWLIDALVERVTGESSGKLAWDLYAGVGLFARKLADKLRARRRRRIGALRDRSSRAEPQRHARKPSKPRRSTSCAANQKVTGPI